jgi:Rrf2 family protein
MRVSAKAEYACVAMFELAVNHSTGEPVRVRTIAQAHGIPLRFLVQILLQLKGAGLVVSVRGASGGYQLTRSPDKISLADVISVIDRATARSDADSLAPSAAVAAIRNVWRGIQAEEQRMLEQVSLAELVRQTQQTSAPSYQI